MSGGSITATGPERVKKHSGKVLLPSAALLLASTGTTFVTTGYFISSFRDIAAGAIILLMSILSIAVIRTAVNRLIFTGFIIAFSAASFISARSEFLRNSIIDSYPTEGLIQDVSAKLNSYNITASIFPQGHENGGICALITYTGSCIPVNGERFSFSARIRKINNTNNSPAEIMLMRRGIFFRIYCSDRDIKFHPSDESATVETFRNKLRLRLDSLFRADIASLLKGLFFGNISIIQPKIVHRYRICGLIHLLAASGLHVGIAAALPLLLLGFLGAGKRTILLGASLTLTFYVAITDLPPSLFRAYIMFCTHTAQVLLGREENPFNSLYLSAMVIVLIRPQDIYSPGFHMSVSAVWGILFFQPRYMSLMKSFPVFLASPLSVTLSAQFLIVPIIALVFGEINLTGIFTNLLMVPLVTLLLALSAFTVAASSALPVLESILVKSVTSLYELSDGILEVLCSAKGHFSLSGGLHLLIPQILFITAALLAGKLRFCSRLLMAAGIFISILITSTASINTEQIPRISGNDDKAGILYVRGKTAYYSGPLKDYSAAREIEDFFRYSGCTSIEINLEDSSFSSIRQAARLSSRIPVTKVIIPPQYIPDRGAKSVFKSFLHSGTMIESADKSSFLQARKIRKAARIYIDCSEAIDYMYGIFRWDTIN